ncbi:MAG: transposase [Endomicrobia bacterium]|nr:transposase [Endomicrobiia bacterium]
MPYRETKFLANSVYHIFTKSIAGYKIFVSEDDFERMIQTLEFYSVENPVYKFSDFLEIKKKEKVLADIPQKKIIKIIAYCIMPTHIHLVLAPLKDDILSSYMNIVLKSYSKYFNVKYNRKGPLWEGRFKSVLVKTDEQLIHLTRYIHLNPVSAYLVDFPQDWKFSSYREYIEDSYQGICNFSDYIKVHNSWYVDFVNDRISYQRELEKIKNLILE